MLRELEVSQFLVQRLDEYSIRRQKPGTQISDFRFRTSDLTPLPLPSFHRSRIRREEVVFSLEK